MKSLKNKTGRMTARAYLLSIAEVVNGVQQIRLVHFLMLSVAL